MWLDLRRIPQEKYYSHIESNYWCLPDRLNYLQQSQPLHIEVVAEKLTVQSIVGPVCEKYNIPYTIGRGYSSLPARWEMIQRFRRSGKEKMCVLILGDFDPEGINIGESLLQSLRGDFGVGIINTMEGIMHLLFGDSDECDIEAVRVGLNPEHIERFELHDNTTEAKKTSTRYAKFVKQYGKKVYELEALTPTQLRQILTEAIDSVIDVDLFNEELEAEKKDAAYLQAIREKANAELFNLLDIEDDQMDGAGEVEF